MKISFFHIFTSLLICLIFANLKAGAVSTTLLKPTKKQVKFFTSGIIEGDESKSIYAKTEGELEFSELSNCAIVKKGQIVAKIKDESRKSALEAAKMSVNEWEKKYKIDSELSKSGLHSKMDFLQTKTKLQNAIVAYEKAERDYQNIVIEAPITGMVHGKKFKVGDIIGKNNLMAKITNLNSFKVALDVPAKMLNKLEKGQTAEVTTSSGKKYLGSITKIKKYADENTKEYEVAILIKTKGESDFPKEGLNSICKVEINMGEKYLYSVPSSAVILDSTGTTALQVLCKDNSVKFIPIEIEEDEKIGFLVSIPNQKKFITSEEGEIKIITRSTKTLSEGEIIAI